MWNGAMTRSSKPFAEKIIELAKTGERNADVLCEQALKDIRRPDE
jgi:hypothetical protein